MLQIYYFLFIFEYKKNGNLNFIKPIIINSMLNSLHSLDMCTSVHTCASTQKASQYKKIADVFKFYRKTSYKCYKAFFYYNIH